MTFREKMDRYRDGTATPEERRAVEEELDKASIINDYLFGGWEEGEPAEAPAGELKQVKKSLRRRNFGLVLTSVVLVVAMLLSVLMVEKQYFDPNRHTWNWRSDLEIALDCYDSLFAPMNRFYSISGYTDTGFGKWTLELCFEDDDELGGRTYRTATVDKNEVHFPKDTFFFAPEKIFNMSPLEPKDMHREAVKAEIEWQLAKVDEDTSVLAIVSFGADINAEELFSLDRKYNVFVRWAAVRAGKPADPMMPLVGVELTMYREDCGVNAVYPELEGEVDAYNIEQHFRSMLTYCRDYEQNTMDIGIIEDPDYYDKVLAELDENGMWFYGGFVSGTRAAFLDMAEAGIITDFYVMDIYDKITFAYEADAFGG